MVNCELFFNNSPEIFTANDNFKKITAVSPSNLILVS